MCGLVFEDLIAQGGLNYVEKKNANKAELEAEFVKEAAKEKMVQLKGHRSVGGMRASIYNAMPLAGVEKLVAFMKDFQARHDG
ncbi:UNVERIFIED_CONTAM: Phosphoserine aminotransferase 1, chloroplastic [Sesamum radiatum]|uniref:Phosphoserine aminotransferase 1, chloroplastic n=1 Tax=Sesamum radiatum TaxID=300843 RepID=A0AAW2RHY5_SESRA